MLYFFCTIFLLLLLNIIETIIKDKGSNSNLFKVGSFLIVFALYIFADIQKFPDLEYYSSLFDNASRVSWSQLDDLSHYEIEYKFELGWCALVKFFSLFLPNSRWHIEVVHLIIMICMWSFVFKNSKNPCLSVILFLLCIFYNSIFVIRQNLVVAVCYCSLPLILERKFKEFLIVIILLMQIHTSAIVFLPMYFLINVKINKKYILLLVTLAVLIYTFMDQLIYLLAVNVPWYGNAAVSNEMLSEGEDASNSTTLLISASIFIFAFAITRLKGLTKIEYLLVHGLLLAILINSARIGSFASLGRLATYFYNGVIVLIPNVCDRIHSKPIKYVAIVSIVCLYAYGAYRSLNYGYHW